MTGSGIGEPVKGREDVRPLTGHGRYADDWNAPGKVLAQEFRSGRHPGERCVAWHSARTSMTARVYEDARIAAERDALVPLGRRDLVVDGGVSGNFLGRLPGIGQIRRK